MTPDGFLSNNAGGILGGISTGQDIVVSIAIKPTSSIRLARKTIDVEGHATTIETRNDIIEKNPDLVQRFVDASAIGWYNYLYGNNKPANDLIKKDNPEMTDAQIVYSIDKMKEYGIVDSGDSLKLGINAMSDARQKSFFDKMVKAKVVDASLDYKKSYTLQFVNKGVGVNLRK